jgi:hypothetical protein
MSITGWLGRLFVAQGLAGALLALLAHTRDRPAAVWVLGFLGAVLVSTGTVLWLFGDRAHDQVQRERAQARARELREHLGR